MLHCLQGKRSNLPFALKLPISDLPEDVYFSNLSSGAETRSFPVCPLPVVTHPGHIHMSWLLNLIYASTIHGGSASNWESGN